MAIHQINITKDNFKESILSVREAHSRCDYQDMCFSTGEVILKIHADNEMMDIEDALEDAGVNLYEYLRPIYMEEGIGWNDESYPESIYEDKGKEFPAGLDISVPCPAIYTRIKGDNTKYYSRIEETQPID